MKSKLKIAAATLTVSVFSASAYDVNTQNFNSAVVSPGGGSTEGVAIFDNTGATLLNGGTTFVGTFSVLPDFGSATTSEIWAAFVQFGGSIPQPPVNIGIEVDGLFSGTLSDSIPNGSTTGTNAFFDRPIYTIVSDVSDPEAAAANFAIFSDGQNFGQENQVGAGASNVNYYSDSNVVYGNVLTGTFDPGGLGAFVIPGVSLTNVPEPSVSLLAGLAGLGLLIRRRR